MDGVTEHFGFILLPGFPLAPVASAVDVLALANYVSEKELYRWHTLALDSDSVTAMNGFRSLVDFSLQSAPSLDSVTLCCGIGGHRFKQPGLLNWLRNQYAAGLKIGAISTGSWVLARAGLLHDKRCTIHWEDLSAFRETYPKLRITDEIFAIDGRIFTCSGGSAATDMFLSFVATAHGLELATAVAEQLVHGRTRPNHMHQRLAVPERIGINNHLLIKAIGLMESHMETPLSQGAIAERLGVSRRHLERLFRSNLGRTPQLYYREIRLNNARTLLRATALSVAEVAFASGFSSASYFAKCYLGQYGKMPTRERTWSTHKKRISS